MKKYILLLPLILMSCVTNAENFPTKPCLVTISATQIVNANFVESIGITEYDNNRIYIKIHSYNSYSAVYISSDKPREKIASILKLIEDTCSK